MLRLTLLLFSFSCCSIVCSAQGELTGGAQKGKKKKTKDKDEYSARFHPVQDREGNTFYMYETEVSNVDYLYVLYKVKEAGDTTLYKALLPDTTVWSEFSHFANPYVEYYLRYPDYRYYPVVGITYEQATKYCQWMTTWYNARPDRQFDQVVIELPDEIQWELAAYGGRSSQFPWGHPYVRDEKGNRLANFNFIDESSVKWDSLGGRRVMVGDGGRIDGHGAMYTSYIYNYPANDYGLYNMAGNVSEMVRYSQKVSSSDIWEPNRDKHWISKGGSFADPGYYMQISSRFFYPKEKASATRGFRISMRVLSPNKKI